MDDRRFVGHPRGLALLFLVEMWERFSYYGMRALLILYLVNVLHWPDARAANLYGTYTGMAFLAPLFGGFLADAFLGTRRSLVIGALIIAAGHFSLAFETLPSFYLGLVLVVIGTGFFKPNVSTMVGQLYAPGDRRRDAGFTIFYIGINLGSFLAPLVCGALAQSETFRHWLVQQGFDPARSWSWGFGAAGVGMLIGLAFYLVFRDRMLPGIGLSPGEQRKATSAPSAPREHQPLTAEERSRVAALLITFVFSIIFWMAFEQAGSSMNLFADRYTDLHLLGSKIPSTWFQGVQPFGILIFAPVFAALWQKLGKLGREPSTPIKMAIGLGLMGIGFGFMVVAGRIANVCNAHYGQSACAIASPVWLITCYLFAAAGELCLSPVGLSYVTKLAPARYASGLMGTWFLATAAGDKLAGSLAAFSSRMPSLSAFFMIPLVACLGAAVILAALAPILKRLTGTAAL